MQLFDAGKLQLDTPVADYLPRFRQSGKEGVTIRHLLTHTSGLIPYRRFYETGTVVREALIDSVLAESLEYEPGTEMRYSDFSMISLMLVIERITGQPFDEYAEEHIFEPLGMHDTGFMSSGSPNPDVVPTEHDRTFRRRLVQGEVHDETAWILGGVSGHAGLFSTAEDLTKFAHMLLEEGRVDGEAFISPENPPPVHDRTGYGPQHAGAWMGYEEPGGIFVRWRRFRPEQFRAYRFYRHIVLGRSRHGPVRHSAHEPGLSDTREPENCGDPAARGRSGARFHTRTGHLHTPGQPIRGKIDTSP